MWVAGPEHGRERGAVVPEAYSRHWKIDPDSVVENPKVTVPEPPTLPAAGPLITDVSGGVASMVKERWTSVTLPAPSVARTTKS